MRPFVLALLGAVAAGPTQAGILVEGRLEGHQVRVELGAIVKDRAVVTVEGERQVVELTAPAPIAPDPYRLTRWSAGPAARRTLSPAMSSSGISGRAPDTPRGRADPPGPYRAAPRR